MLICSNEQLPQNQRFLSKLHVSNLPATPSQALCHRNQWVYKFTPYTVSNSTSLYVGKLTGIDFPYEHWSLEIIRLSSDQTKMILWSMILVTQINWTSNKQLKWQVKMFWIQIAILCTRPAMDANRAVFLIFFKNCDLWYIKVHSTVSIAKLPCIQICEKKISFRSRNI